MEKTWVKKKALAITGRFMQLASVPQELSDQRGQLSARRYGLPLTVPSGDSLLVSRLPGLHQSDRVFANARIK